VGLQQLAMACRSARCPCRGCARRAGEARRRHPGTCRSAPVFIHAGATQVDSSLDGAGHLDPHSRVCMTAPRASPAQDGTLARNAPPARQPRRRQVQHLTIWSGSTQTLSPTASCSAALADWRSTVRTSAERAPGASRSLQAFSASSNHSGCSSFSMVRRIRRHSSCRPLPGRALRSAWRGAPVGSRSDAGPRLPCAARRERRLRSTASARQLFLGAADAGQHAIRFLLARGETCASSISVRASPIVARWQSVAATGHAEDSLNVGTSRCTSTRRGVLQAVDGLGEA